MTRTPGLFRGWIAHVGTVNVSEYVLCARKPDIYTTPVTDATTGEPVTLYATGTEWFFKYCRHGYERLMRAQLPLGSVAPMEFVLQLGQAEAVPVRPSPWLSRQEAHS